jgi:hypothetical protein
MEKEDKEDQKIVEELRELFCQLPGWGQYRVYLYVKWLALRQKLRRTALNWLMFQVVLDKKTKALISSILHKT